MHSEKNQHCLDVSGTLPYGTAVRVLKPSVRAHPPLRTVIPERGILSSAKEEIDQ